MTETNPPAVWWSPEYQRFYALPGTPTLVEEVETRFMPFDIQRMVPEDEVSRLRRIEDAAQEFIYTGGTWSHNELVKALDL